MSDTYSETTSQSWFGRIGESIKGALFGVVLIFVAAILLFWNEGRTVKRYRTLKEGSGIVVSVDPASVNAANNDKLVHTSAVTATDSVLTDNVFGLSRNAIRLKREVSMYQWSESKETETEKKLGGGKTTKTIYSYSKVWSSRRINSSNFKKSGGHVNPAMLFKSSDFVAQDVTLGAFSLSGSLVNQLSNYTPVAVQPSEITFPPNIADRHIDMPDGFFVGQNADDPQVGDMRVVFKAVMPEMVSVVAKQAGKKLTFYVTKTDDTIELLEPGELTAKQMFSKAQSDNSMMGWLLRGGGFVAMFIGFAMIFSIFGVLADVIPLFGSIVGFGTKVASFLLAFMISMFVIAVAWFFYRPVIAGCLFVVAVTPFIVVYIKSGKKNSLNKEGRMPKV